MRLRILLTAFVLLLAGAVPASSGLHSPARPQTVATAATSPSPAPAEYAGPSTQYQQSMYRAVADAVRAYEAFAEAKRQADAAEAEAAQRQTTRSTAAAPTPAAPIPADPAPPPATGGGNAEDAVRRYFPDLFDQAWGVSGCESGHDPSAVSAGGGNWGLFQINTVHKKSFVEVTGRPWTDVLDAGANAQFARWLYDSSGGWGPWSCRWAAR